MKNLQENTERRQKRRGCGEERRRKRMRERERERNTAGVSDFGYVVFGSFWKGECFRTHSPAERGNTRGPFAAEVMAAVRFTSSWTLEKTTDTRTVNHRAQRRCSSLPDK